MAFYAGVLGSLTGQAQGKKEAYADAAREAATANDATEKKRQFDAQLGLQQQQVAQTGAVDQWNIDREKHQQSLDDRANGVGLEPWKPPLNHGVAPTPAQKAALGREEEHYYLVHGATVQAAAAGKSVKELDAVVKSQNAAAAKTQEDANHLVEIMGRIGHWGDQTKVELKRVAMQETVQVLRGQQTEDVARQKIAAAGSQLLQRIQAQLQVANLNVAERAKASADLDAVRTAIAQIQQGGANGRAMLAQGLEQTDASGNPMMAGAGGATINVYGSSQPQIQPPAINPQQGGSGVPPGGVVQPPPVRAPIQPPPVSSAQGQSITATSPQPPPIVDLSKATRRAVTADGTPVGLVNGQWRDARGTVYGADGKPIKK